MMRKSCRYYSDPPHPLLQFDLICHRGNLNGQRDKFNCHRGRPPQGDPSPHFCPKTVLILTTYDFWNPSKKTRTGKSSILAVLSTSRSLSPRTDLWTKWWMVRTPKYKSSRNTQWKHNESGQKKLHVWIPLEVGHSIAYFVMIMRNCGQTTKHAFTWQPPPLTTLLVNRRNWIEITSVFITYLVGYNSFA